VLSLACRRETPVAPVSPTTSTRSSTATPAIAHDGGRLQRRLEGNVRTLNYLLQTTEDETQVLSFLYDPLLDFDAELTPIAATAARWEVLDGGKTYVFHLDPRANFSDGQPVRASDVVFTLNKVIDAKSTQFAARFEGLDRAQTRAVDEHTVRVVFKEPRVSQLFAFNLGVMPEHIYAKENFEKTSKVVGNGPYVIKRRGRDRTILLERRANYWRELPPIREILFRPIADDAVALNALRRGDVDVSHVNNDVWTRIRDDAAIQQKVEFRDVYQLGYNCILWNLSEPLLTDVRVRRALAMSFDRQTVIDKLYHGQARAVSGPFTPDQWANNPDVTPIAYNLEAAAALLTSAGWRDTDHDGVLDRNGKKFALTLLILAGNATSRDHAQILQESLRRIGVALEIKALDEAAFYDLVLQRNYQAAYVSWVNDPDPDPYTLFHSSQLAPAGMNVVGYNNPEADQLMDDARIEQDPTRRADLYHQLHEILARDQPYLWTVQVAEKWAINRRVQNVQVAKGLGLFGWYPGPRGWWLKP